MRMFFSNTCIDPELLVSFVFKYLISYFLFYLVSHTQIHARAHTQVHVKSAGNSSSQQNLRTLILSCQPHFVMILVGPFSLNNTHTHTNTNTH